VLLTLERWAREDGWQVSNGESLPSELRTRTDVLLKEPLGPRYMRIAILPKAKGGSGALRIDASTHRIFELLYQRKRRRWRVETATLPLADDLQQLGWSGLKDFAFRP
jgi:hypothetical protein